MLKYLKGKRKMIGKIIKFLVAAGSLFVSTFLVQSCGR